MNNANLSIVSLDMQGVNDLVEFFPGRPTMGYDIAEGKLTTSRSYKNLNISFGLDSRYFREFYIRDHLNKTIGPNEVSPFYSLGVIDVSTDIYHPSLVNFKNYGRHEDKDFYESLKSVFECYEEIQGAVDSPLAIMGERLQLLQVQVDSIYGPITAYVEKKLRSGNFVYGFIEVPHATVPLKILLVRVYVVSERLVCQAFMAGSCFCKEDANQDSFVVVGSENRTFRAIQFSKYVRNAAVEIDYQGTVNHVYKNVDETLASAHVGRIFVVPVYYNEISVIGEEKEEVCNVSDFAALGLDLVVGCSEKNKEDQPKKSLWQRIKDYFIL